VTHQAKRHLSFGDARRAPPQAARKTEEAERRGWGGVLEVKKFIRIGCRGKCGAARELRSREAQKTLQATYLKYDAEETG
jgi:hypothetical protein